MGIARQLASMVGFVIVLLLTGVANVALVPQAESVGRRGDSPEREGELGEKSQSQDEQHEIEEDEHREKRLQNTRIGRISKTAKSAESIASSGNDAQETPPKAQSTRLRRRSAR